MTPELPSCVVGPPFGGAPGWHLSAILCLRSATFNRQDSPVNAAWRIGQNVQHAKFGPGVVINYEGSGSDARVQVNFAQVGIKWLLVEYAKLTGG